MKGKKFLSLGMAAVLACSAFPATSYAMETDAEVYEETDIIGGSPFTSSAELLRQEGFLERSLILTGMNMPVLVQLLLQKDDSALEQLKSEVKAISAGTIQIFEEESEDEDEEL